MAQHKSYSDEEMQAIQDAVVDSIAEMSEEDLRAELAEIGENPEDLIRKFDVVLERAASESEMSEFHKTGRSTCNTQEDEQAQVSENTFAFHDEIVNPFSSHDQRSLRTVAKTFGCTSNFIARLKDRLVRTEDMTLGFLTALAQSLGTAVDPLSRFLACPPEVPLGARFKADGKPVATHKQSLAEALDDAGLSDEQKRRLLAM